MITKKNDSLKCIKCGNKLNDNNWNAYDKVVNHYICKKCRKIQDRNRQFHDPEYSIKQRNRHRMRKSAVIFHYGNQCAQCGEDDYTKLKIHTQKGGSQPYDALYNGSVNKKMHQVLCYNCSKSLTPIKDKYALRDKKKVMEAYGNQCQCGENRAERLTLQNQMDKTGVALYRWLIKQNYPQDMGLRVVCFNCNYSKIASAKLAAEESDLSRH